MTYKVSFMVEDLTAALKGLRADGLLARQSSEVPDLVVAYGKDKEALITGVREFHKTRGFENIKLDEDYFNDLVSNEKVTDEELLNAAKEPEHKEVSVQENKTEADLYAEVHPLDLGGVKHALNDEELLAKIKEGKDFSVKLDEIDEKDPAVVVTEAQTQRGGSGNPGDESANAKLEPSDSKESKEVLAKSVEIATANEDAKNAK